MALEEPDRAVKDAALEIVTASAHIAQLAQAKWYWLLAEVEVEAHEGCLGYECDCWRKEKE